MDTHPMSNRLIMDRKHWCRHSESDLHGQQNSGWNPGQEQSWAAGEEAGSRCSGISGHLTDDQTEVWPAGRAQCIYPLLGDEQGRKIDPVSKSSLAPLLGKQDNIVQK